MEPSSSALHETMPPWYSMNGSGIVEIVFVSRVLRRPLVVNIPPWTARLKERVVHILVFVFCRA